MESVRQRRISELFARCVQMEAKERDAFLVRECAGDPDILDEVKALLANHLETWLTDQVADLPHPRPSDAPSVKTTVALRGFERAPERIGPYRILERIGEGGMGEVYLVEQERPIHRRAALKIIKLGMDTKEVIGRFEAERQALALMDHPNVAKVFDAGTTETGRPYFVMEYVPGIPITEYCDENRLSTKDRLRLFVGVCQAIHHAHQKAIIHRDVKPSNVLVMVQDGKPVAKVIDFGVAKAINQRLTERTVYTEQGTLIGTPAYMSPEQAELTGLNVDTTTDVYSLGALLYELLTGRAWIDMRTLREQGYSVVQRTIKEREPVRPSTRISRLGKAAEEVAKRQRTDAAGLIRELRGELDWITLRAMEKDRTRRYPSASELAADVGRYLTNEPVLARPHSVGYQLRKMVSRHKPAFAFAGTVVFLLVAATIIVGTLWQKSERARRRAHTEALRAEASNLLALGRSELRTNPTAALAYATKSLEFSDRFETRRFIMRALWRGPTRFQLPTYGAANVGAVRFSPDGEWLAAGHMARGEVFLYPAAGGTPVELVGHDGIIWSVEFVGTDRLLTSGSDRTVRIWSVPGGEMIRKWEFDAQFVDAYASPDGEHFYTVEAEAGIAPLWKVWTLEGQEPLREARVGETIADLSGWGAGFGIHPETGHIALWKDGEILLVPPDDPATSAPVRVGRHDGVAWTAFDRRGRRLASMDDSGGVRVWTMESGHWISAREFRFPDAAGVPRFDPSGTALALGFVYDVVPIWDLAGPVGMEPLKLGGKLYYSYDIAFHPSGRWLVSTSDGLTLSAWPLSRRYCYVLPGEVTRPVFAPDGSWLAASGDDCIRIWPLDGSRERESRCVFSTTKYVRTVNVGPMGENLVVSLGDGEVTVVPVDGGQPRLLEGWMGTSYGAVFDPTGTRIAAWGSAFKDGRGGLIKVWNLATGDVQTLPQGSEVPRLFTPDGRLLSVSYVVRSDRRSTTLFLWDVETKRNVALLEGIANHNIGLTPDARFVLYEAESGGLLLRDLEGGEQKRLPVIEGKVVVCALNRTGSIAALGMLDGTVWVIYTDTMKAHMLLGHEKAIQGVAIDPRDRWVASWDVEGSRLWPLTGVEPLHSLPRDALLDRLRSLTNLRAVSDTSLASGYRIEVSAFPGWEAVPTW